MEKDERPGRDSVSKRTSDDAPRSGTRFSRGRISLSDLKNSSAPGNRKDSGKRTPSVTSPTSPVGTAEVKSASAEGGGSTEAWATSRQLSVEEKRAQEIAEAVKQKKAAFSMSPPKVQDIESRQLRVAWDACRLDEPVKYHLEMAAGSSEDFKELYSGDDLQFIVTGLTPGSPYSFRLYSSTTSLTGDSSRVAMIDTKPDIAEIPGAPRLAQRNRNNLSMKWPATADNGSPITAYTLQWDQGLGSSDADNFVDIYTGKERQFKVSEKLQPGQAYSFRLCAENGIGKSGWSPVSTQYTAAGVPNQPNVPRLVRRTAYCIAVAWEEPESNGACVTEYKLEMDDLKSGYGFRSAYSGEMREYSCDKLVPAETYKFRVSAVNSQGCSRPSEVASYLTLAAPPGPPVNVRQQGRPQPFSFAAEWDIPAVSGGGDVTEYVAEIADRSGADSSYAEVYCGADRRCDVSSLMPGQNYSLRVAACSEEGGRGEWAQAMSVKLPATVPGSPAAPYVSGRPKSSSVVIAWGPPEFNGGAEVTSYHLEVLRDGASDFTPVYEGPRTSHNVATLQPGMTYKFRVKASNLAGKGMYSTACTANTGAAPPGSPSDVSVEAVSASVLQVSWMEPATHGTPVREYFVELQQQDEEFTQVYRGKDMSCDLGFLKPATTYSFRVSALSDSGQGPWSMLTSGTTLPGPPAVVTGVSLVSASSDELTVSWRVPSGNGQPVTHYFLEIVGTPQTLTESSTRATFSNLKSSTPYRVRVQAVNRVGSGPFSSVLTAMTRSSRPMPPSIELAGRYHNALKFRWTARQVCDYQLQVAADGVSPFETVYSGSALTHKVTSLQPASTYRVRVCAENEAGSSGFCEVQKHLTTEAPPPPPKDVRVESIQIDSALVQWQPLITNGRPAAGYSQACQLEIQLMEDGGEYRTIYTGDGGHTSSHSLSSLRPGVKHSVRARVKEVSAVADGAILYSVFSRAVTFTMLSPAPVDNESGRAEQRKSPKAKAQASPQATSAATAPGSGKTKPYSRGKRPPKAIPVSKPAANTVSSDQRQAIFILVLFGVVTVIVAVAAAIYFSSQ